MNFIELADLAAERVGGRALEANDEFFASKRNLVKPGRGIFIADKYTSRGKWMDGWETRRRRVPGHDWCVLKLGMRGIIRGVDIDTNHFVGNYPQQASLDARDGKGPWSELLPPTALQGTSQNLFELKASAPSTHVRLNIFPDGGVARLRVYGEVVPVWDGGMADLASIKNGGLVVATSDQFFGHRNNIIMPGRSKNMGDGWETKRRRGPGHDWLILKLGRPGALEKIEIDTNHFKGNYPDRCSLEGGDGENWEEILPPTKLQPHKRHFLSVRSKAVSHVRFNIYPDGGVSRLRLYGRPS